jgi:hypothetical protein
MWTFWSRDQATLNEVYNNPESQNPGLIEPSPVGNLVSKNPKYANDTIKSVNLR